MPASRTVGVLCFALAAGCAGVTEAPTGVLAQTEPLVVDPTPVAQSQDGAVAAEPSRSVTKVEEIVAPAPQAPAAKRPARISAPPAAIEQARKKDDPPPAARKLEPTLDVAGLTARLRDTKAFGVLTKLALKNQVDDLLEQCRAFHQSGQKTGVTSLRQAYDTLVFKVLSLLQGGDPSLARAISGSREAIWGILSDPEKFHAAA